MNGPVSSPLLDLLEEIFEPLIDNPFFVKDSELRYIAVNRAMLRLCGVRYRSDMIGRTAREMYPATDAARYELDERRVLSGFAIVDRVEQIRAVRRPPVWLILSQRPLRTAGGDIIGVIGVSRHMRRDFASDRQFEGFAAALQFVRQNFDKPLDGKRAAGKAGLSLSQLEREFTKVLGVTPRLYQQRVRIEEAMRLLPQDLTIAQIAHACGFSDHSSFARRFKTLTGQTPTGYREDARRSAVERQNRRATQS